MDKPILATFSKKIITISRYVRWKYPKSDFKFVLTVLEIGPDLKFCQFFFVFFSLKKFRLREKNECRIPNDLPKIFKKGDLN